VFLEGRGGKKLRKGKGSWIIHLRDCGLVATLPEEINIMIVIPMSLLSLSVVA
jgi:hypothetical protein